MDKLIGRVIQKIEVDKHEQQYLVFETDVGRLVYCAYGDCCSESWFADITGVDALLGGRVVAVEGVDMGWVSEEKDKRCRQEHDQLYGYKLTTDKGRAEIVFRNSSNGYYGGWIDEVEEIHKDGPAEFETITDDWSASAPLKTYPR